MDNKINLAQLTELFCKESTLAKGVSATFVKSFFETVISEVSAGEQVRIKGFGTFKQTTINDRESVNVNTGERFVIPGHTKISFTPDPVLKDFINKPFANFETVIIDVPESDGNKDAALVTALADNLNEAVSEKPLEVDDKSKVPAEENNCSPAASESEPKPVRKRMIGLRTLMKILGVLLTVLIISYCIWPLNLMHLMRSKMDQMETADSKVAKTEVVRNEKSQKVRSVQAENGQIQTEDGQVQTADEQVKSPVGQQSVTTGLEEVSTDQKPSTTGQKPAAAEQKQTDAQSVFTLTAADLARPVGSFTAADTISYRMLDVMATHTLSEGETLVRLSGQYYGTKILWPYIAAYNGIDNADMLHVGMKIDIPRLANR